MVFDQEQCKLFNINADQADTEILDGADEGDFLFADGPKQVILKESDRSLEQLYKWHRAGKLITDPEWQRHYVWNDKKASMLIESFLLHMPVPVVYLLKTHDGKYEIIDGQQRLVSVFRFLSNAYSLKGLEVLDHNGCFYKDLPKATQGELEDCTIKVFELQPNTSIDLIYLIFGRLNTGGMPLNDQEIRNCLFKGTLNSKICELAVSKNFITCVNQNNISKRMADRSMVLRFFAFYEKTYKKANRGLKSFINDFLETYKNCPSEKLCEFENVFNKCMKACVTVFGDNGFRTLSEKNGSLAWANKVNMCIFQVIATSFSSYDIGQITRRSDSILEEYINLLTEDKKWVDAVSSRTSNFNNIQYTFQEWERRLKYAIGDEEPNDKQRCFSLELKKKMYTENNTCHICGQAISALLDAALDHDVDYWRGGKTVPENARLVHRLCNQKKPNVAPVEVSLSLV